MNTQTFLQPLLIRSFLLRRTVAGSIAGAVAGALLSPVFGVAGGIVAGAVGGAGIAVRQRPQRAGEGLDRLVSCAAFGVPAWAAANVVVFPMLGGQMPRWDAEGLRALYPLLVQWLLFGAALGLLTELGLWLTQHFFGSEPVAVSAPEPAPVATRVVILGGGFAGVTAAQHLESRFADDPSVGLTLVSETNALLFTPMLAEVAASSLEPTHISAPLRTSLRRTEVVHGKVASIDLAQKRVLLENGAALPYEHLVLALGAVSNYLGNEAVEEHSLDFKSLADAIRIRNHVIAAFDRADAETDPAQRRALLTFVVAGGGFSGAELAGGLNDFTRGMLADYPRLAMEDLRVVLIHSRERILPELPASLADYALERMRARGVTFKLKARVASAREDAVVLEDGEEIAARTLVWTAGTAPSPLLKDMPVQRDKRGAILVEPTLEVPGHPGVWALGDCASVPDAKTGQPCPPTAQFALREAATLARNLHASLRGKPLRGFHFDNLGTLCVVGHHTACADIKGLKFSGLFAWLLWRGIYLSKLPGFERKVRVLSDWIIELFFPRDIVQTLDFEPSRVRKAPR